MTNFLGKKPATYDKRDIRYADLRSSVSLPFPVSQLPVGWDHSKDFTNTAPPVGWGMLGNGPADDASIPSTDAAYQGCGDCAWAGPAHEEMQAAKQAGRPVPQFSAMCVVKQYAANEGYNPVTGDNDNGSDVRGVLNVRQKKGLLDNSGLAYKIGVYVALELGDWQSLREATYIFESVGLGFNFPDSAMDQLNNGQIWSVVPGATIEGGHYVPIVGHPGNNLWSVITWGQRQLATWNFINTYADELWAYVDPERYNQVTGLTAEHYTDYDLERYIKMFPAPV